MITAQDIREKTFEKATFGGYAMNEVDDFLDELANDIAAAQKESAALRGKMKVLADKIVEYRESEDELHRALVTAQKMAKSIEEESQAKADALIADAQGQADATLAEAQAQADAILSDARAQADAVTGNIRQLREAEELRYQRAQSSAADCIQVTTKKLAETLAYLRALQDADLIGAIVTPVPDERKAIPAPAEELAEEAAEAVEEAPEVEEAAAEAAEEAVEAVEEAAAEAAEDVAELAEDVAEAAEEAAEEPAEEPIPAATGRPDYFQEFERAVYQAQRDLEETIPDAEDGSDAPLFRF